MFVFVFVFVFAVVAYFLFGWFGLVCSSFAWHDFFKHVHSCDPDQMTIIFVTCNDHCHGNYSLMFVDCHQTKASSSFFFWVFDSNSTT